jgi:hypothetical protein
MKYNRFINGFSWKSWNPDFTKGSIINIIKNLIPKELPKPVGRWKVEECNIKMSHKVDLSNEDHCGPCGQYALEKIELKKNEIIDKLQ